jgi:hypothetical protein
LVGVWRNCALVIIGTETIAIDVIVWVEGTRFNRGTQIITVLIVGEFLSASVAGITTAIESISIWSELESAGSITSKWVMLVGVSHAFPNWVE